MSLVLQTVPAENGLLDAFIMGEGGIPIARLSEPLATVDEVLRAAREWKKQQEAETEEDE